MYNFNLGPFFALCALGLVLAGAAAALFAVYVAGLL